MTDVNIAVELLKDAYHISDPGPVTPPTVKSYVHRARRQVQTMLSQGPPPVA